MSKLNERPLVLRQKIWSRLFEAAKFVAMNKKERQAYISKMTTERDIRNQIEYAREIAIEEGLAVGIAKGIAKGKVEGRAEGRAEGAAETKLEVAKNMKAKGIDLLTISECTGLTPDEIGKL